MAKKKTPSRKPSSGKTSSKNPRTSKSVLCGTILLVLSLVCIVFILRQDDFAGFGIGGFLLFAIPVCIAVRLLVKTSRISIPKSAAIALSGFVIVNAWIAVSTGVQPLR